ncbi:ROK family protein [Cellulomonas alba]|uniref:ROK family protein n=1 Tax=Cellulomonas alba TaxID=3053467 RepID=A0ABT7SIC7_9CELL|nr:ROK family protein [Cellulomonas alba]MDM7855915.1 ROK family protein [Cellulomonas alba]
MNAYDEASLDGMPGRPRAATPLAGRSGGWAVGLDIGGTKVLGVAVDPDGVPRHEVRTATVRGLDGVVTGAADAVERLAALAGIGVGELVGVGIGVPGVVVPGDGSVEHAVNLGIAGRVPLAAHLHDRLGGVVPVRVENDLNAAVVGAAAATDGAHGLAPDVAFLALGTGVAAGLLLDGRLRRGVRGSAGEIGHLTLVPDGLPCKCGRAGCLEQYASGSALDAAWPSTDGRPSPALVFEAAEAGDAVAVALRDRFAWAVGSAVRILVLTCDVGRVVIGGGVAAIGEPLLDVVRAALLAESRQSPFLASLDLAERVTLAPAGVPVGALGAALVGRGTYA